MKKQIINGIKLLAAIIIISSFIGCAPAVYTPPKFLSDYEKFYSQQAPSKYPQTERIKLFEYRNISIDDIQKILFDDYLVIGKSVFNGSYVNPRNAISYAKSIGADVLVTTAQFKEKITKLVPTTVPTSSTTGFFAGSSLSSYTTATTYGTRTITKQVTVDRYDQHGIFLKNINNINPLWERTEVQYKKTKTNQIEGIWKNENYKLNIFQSGEQIVAFVIDTSKARQGSWRKDDLKFIFGVKSNKGVYLMGDKTPRPTKFGINKFGHLELELITSGQKFSFGRE